MFKYRGHCEFDGLVCPFGCENKKIEYMGTCTTLVGWSGGEDPNHQTTTAKCIECNQTFNKHFVIAGKKVWYERDGYVLLGEPGCCKSLYFIQCECGGWKSNSHKNKGIHYINNIPEPSYYECSDCHKITEAPNVR